MSAATIPFPASRLQTISPMILADRLLTLAQDAERAGLATTADRLVVLACNVFDERGSSDFSHRRQ